MAYSDVHTSPTPLSVAPQQQPPAAPAGARRLPAPVHRGFRPDIEGLRAVAVLVVVLYHGGVKALGGGFTGVDVFFVISGFLITGHLLQEMDQTGSINLAQFWARRVRRLLPALTVVVVATSIAVALWWEILRRARALIDLSWGALYAANWRFAQLDVDYLTAGQRSPALHLWSLGVEEQFYLLWPLLLVAVILATRRPSWRPHRRAAVVATLATSWVVSFGWNLVWSHSRPSWAYYSLPTRLWQLATGALLACGLGWWARRRFSARVALVWAGLGAIGVGVVLLHDAGGTPYPGVVALLPTLGAGAVIASGVAPWPQPGQGTQVRVRPAMQVVLLPVRVLSSWPMQRIGNLSYGWYLWHWPLLVLAPAVVGHALTTMQAVAVAGLGLVAAAISARLVENPIRRAPGALRRAGWSLALGAALTGLCVGVTQVTLHRTAAGAVTHQFTQITEQGNSEQVHVRLSPVQARYDAALMGTCHVGQAVTSLPPGCDFGASTDSGRVLMAGDSHAGQWFPAVMEAADQRGLGVTAWTKSWCQLADVRWQLNAKPYDQCSQWREQVLQQATSGRYSVLVTSSSAVVGMSQERMPMRILGPDGRALPTEQVQQTWSEGYLRTVQRLQQAGVKVVVIRDTPYMRRSVPECLAQFPQQAHRCSPARWRAEPGGEDVRLAAQVGATTGDFTDLLCSPQRCHALIDGYIAWWDKAHLAGSYVRTLAPQVGALLDQALRSP